MRTLSGMPVVLCAVTVAALQGVALLGTADARAACATVTQFVVSPESTQTYAAVDQVTISQSGTWLTGSLRYEIYNVANPAGEIDQLFLAVDRYVIATIYSGHPGGCPGQKASWSASNTSLAGLPSGTYTLYVARTAATSVDAGINHYENENGGWRVAIGSVTIGSTAPTWTCNPTITQYVVSNAGTQTYAAVDQVTISQSGTWLTGSLRYEIYNVANPAGEIDQLFLAVDRYVIATIYSGHPGGCPGQKASWSASNTSLAGLPSGTYTLYVARTAATSVDAGINHYENENGGWRVAIGSVSVSSQSTRNEVPGDDAVPGRNDVAPTLVDYSICPLTSLAAISLSLAGIATVRPHRESTRRASAPGSLTF